MDGENVINILIGMVMPLLVAVVNQSHWGPRVRAVMAVVLCAAVAVLTSWLRGDLSWADWRVTLVYILGAALIAYQVWWKPSTWAPTIEAVTTIGGPRVD